MDFKNLAYPFEDVGDTPFNVVRIFVHDTRLLWLDNSSTMILLPMKHRHGWHYGLHGCPHPLKSDTA